MYINIYMAITILDKQQKILQKCHIKSIKIICKETTFFLNSIHVYISTPTKMSGRREAFLTLFEMILTELLVVTCGIKIWWEGGGGNPRIRDKKLKLNEVFKAKFETINILKN